MRGLPRSLLLVSLALGGLGGCAGLPSALEDSPDPPRPPVERVIVPELRSPRPVDRPGPTALSVARNSQDLGDLPPGPSRDEFTPVGRSAVETKPLMVDLRAPRTAVPGESFLAAVELINPGPARSPAATVTLQVPEGIELSTISSAPKRQQPGRYTWAFEPLPPDSTRTVTFRIQAPRTKQLALSVEAVDDNQARATQRASVTLGQAELAVRSRSPEQHTAGEVVRIPITVTNTGSLPAEKVSVFATLPEGKPVELRFGTIAARGERTETLQYTPTQAGPWRVTLDAVGGKSQSAQSEVRGEALSRGPREPRVQDVSTRDTPARDVPARPVGLPPPPPPPVGRPVIAVEWLRAPLTLNRGELIRAVVVVRNRGTAAAERIELTVSGDGIETRSGDGPSGITGRRVGEKILFPALTSLEPGASAEFTVDLAGGTIGPGRLDASVTARHQPLPLREERSVRIAQQ